MISSVRGEVLEVALDHAVIEAAGVGYHVNATPSTLATLRHGSEARLITAMIVREDSQTLYGFPDRDTRDLFLTLLSVSGVGPRLAMATLAVHDAATLRQVLADGDVVALTRVPGIGKRSAERMVLELRDKLPQPATDSAPVTPSLSAIEEDVVSALVNLGYQRAAAEKVLDLVKRDKDKNKGGSFDALFRGALAALSK